MTMTIKRNNTYLKGHQNPNAKLSQEDVEWIRKNGVHHKVTDLAKRFGVDRSTINRVMRRESYRGES